MSDRSTTRRAVLASLPVPALASLAGCTDVLGDPSTPTPAPLTALEETTVYVDPGLSLSVPDGVPTTDVPGDATVVLVPGDTDRSHSAIVHWLARDAFVAFLGEENQDTWHEIKESDAYAAMLGEPRGRSQACTSSSSGDGHAGGSVSVGGTDSDDCDPPALLVAWATEDPPTATARASWGAPTSRAAGRCSNNSTGRSTGVGESRPPIRPADQVATMSYSKTNYDDVEPVAEGLHFLREPLDCDNLGVSVLECPPDWEGQPHDHVEDGQEEVYVCVDGKATVTVDGEDVRMTEGDGLRLSPDATRQISADQPARFVLVGAP